MPAYINWAEPLKGKMTYFLGVVIWRERRVVALFYLLAQGVQVHFITVKGTLQRSHLFKEMQSFLLPLTVNLFSHKTHNTNKSQVTFNHFQFPAWKCHSAKNGSSKLIAVASVCTYSMPYSRTCDNPGIAVFKSYTVRVLLTEYEEALSSSQHCCEHRGLLHHKWDKKRKKPKTPKKPNHLPRCKLPLRMSWKKTYHFSENIIWSKAISRWKCWTTVADFAPFHSYYTSLW